MKLQLYHVQVKLGDKIVDKTINPLPINEAGEFIFQYKDDEQEKQAKREKIAKDLWSADVLDSVSRDSNTTQVPQYRCKQKSEYKFILIEI